MAQFKLTSGRKRICPVNLLRMYFKVQDMRSVKGQHQVSTMAIWESVPREINVNIPKFLNGKELIGCVCWLVLQAVKAVSNTKAYQSLLDIPSPLAQFKLTSGRKRICPINLLRMYFKVQDMRPVEGQHQVSTMAIWESVPREINENIPKFLRGKSWLDVCVDLSSRQRRLFPILRLTKACWMYPPPLGTWLLLLKLC
jgi:hypothetical protein